eukprot:TRINITY_DN5794_c0_g1_i1.p1 TRINITY_DN5794_c0_g1~~TRINITY_DN5794_c0_g1_i1.p1  ORF type:complete len:617 (-),score=176.26 TRINITY_DN5794_c0_g1_i1:60-1910(-)
MGACPQHFLARYNYHYFIGGQRAPSHLPTQSHNSIHLYYTPLTYIDLVSMPNPPHSPRAEDTSSVVSMDYDDDTASSWTAVAVAAKPSRTTDTSDTTTTTTTVDDDDKYTLNMSFMHATFPNKDESKLQRWLQELQEHEFDHVGDLGPLADGDWEQVALPLAIKSKLRQVASQYEEDKAKEQSDALDAAMVSTTAQLAPPTPVRPLSQLDCIVMDVSSSMRARSSIDPDKTREDVSKLLFHTMVDKLVGLELAHAVGLVAFGHDITQIKEPTREYERFHDELGRLDADQYSTKLWDAIYHAVNVLLEYKEAHSTQCADDVILRVFVLTDGHDNSSEHAAWSVAQYLQQVGVVLDVIPLDGPNATLQAMAAASRGMCFGITSVEQSVGLFEREAILHIAYREDSGEAPPAINSLHDLQSLKGTSEVKTDVVRAVAKSVTAPVMSAQSIQKEASKAVGGPAKRIFKEYQDFMRSPPAGWSVYVSQDDMRSWKAIFTGLSGTAYQDGHWLLTIDFPHDYPFSAPKVRFVTPIYHCNISRDGALCLDILKDCWTPGLTISKVLTSIANLLTDPNPNDPLDAYKGQLCRDEPQQYLDNVKDYVQRYATHTFDEVCAQYNLV